MSQQCVGSDVKGHAEKRVGGTLVELAVQNASVLDFELEESVARRKIDVLSLAWIPTGDDQSARIRIGLDQVYEIGDLIDAVALGIVSAKRAPEIAVNWSKITCRSSELLRVCLV